MKMINLARSEAEKRKAVKRKKGCRERFRKVTTTNVAICPHHPPPCHANTVEVERWRQQ